MFRLGIYQVYTRYTIYIPNTNGIYQVYFWYMTCSVDICWHGTFLHAKMSYIRYSSGIYLIFFRYIPGIYLIYDIYKYSRYIPDIYLVYIWIKSLIWHWMCAWRHRRSECVVGVIVRLVLGWHARWLWRVAVVVEEKRERALQWERPWKTSARGTYNLTLTPTVPHADSFFSATRLPIKWIT